MALKPESNIHNSRLRETAFNYRQEQCIGNRISEASPRVRKDSLLLSCDRTFHIHTYYIYYINRVLRRIFGRKRDENGEWRRLHNEELHSLYRSPNIVRVIKSRR